MDPQIWISSFEWSFFGIEMECFNALSKTEIYVIFSRFWMIVPWKWHWNVSVDFQQEKSIIFSGYSWKRMHFKLQLVLFLSFLLTKMRFKILCFSKKKNEIISVFWLITKYFPPPRKVEDGRREGGGGLKHDYRGTYIFACFRGGMEEGKLT